MDAIKRKVQVTFQPHLLTKANNQNEWYGDHDDDVDGTEPALKKITVKKSMRLIDVSFHDFETIIS